MFLWLGRKLDRLSDAVLAQLIAPSIAASVVALVALAVQQPWSRSQANSNWPVSASQWTGDFANITTRLPVVDERDDPIAVTAYRPIIEDAEDLPPLVPVPKRTPVPKGAEWHDGGRNIQVSHDEAIAPDFTDTSEVWHQRTE